MQKKSPLYEELKEDTVWSMDRFNDYVNENFQEKYELPEDWVHIVLKVSMFGYFLKLSRITLTKKNT